MNVKQYLNRIGYNGVRDTTLQVLQNLCSAHSYSVPFTNSNMISGRNIEFTLQAIFNKIVKEKQGGICYEINSLFHWLLKKLGFQAEILQGQTFYEQLDDYGDKFNHLVIQVEIEKERYLVDVGYAGLGFVYPLRFSLETDQAQTNGTYRIKQLDDCCYVVERKRKNYVDSTGERCFATDNPKYFASSSAHRVDGWDIMYKLTTEHHEMIDFSDMLHRRQSDPNDFYRHNFLCLLHSHNGFTGVWGDMTCQKSYYIHDDNDQDNVTIKVALVRLDSNKIVRNFVKSKFGILLPRNFQAKDRDRRMETVY